MTQSFVSSDSLEAVTAGAQHPSPSSPEEGDVLEWHNEQQHNLWAGDISTVVCVFRHCPVSLLHLLACVASTESTDLEQVELHFRDPAESQTLFVRFDRCVLAASQ